MFCTSAVPPPHRSLLGSTKILVQNGGPPELSNPQGAGVPRFLGATPGTVMDWGGGNAILFTVPGQAEQGPISHTK